MNTVGRLDIPFCQEHVRVGFKTFFNIFLNIMFLLTIVAVQHPQGQMIQELLTVELHPAPEQGR